MRYYLIAGEASGDLHASNLMRELKIRDQEADFRCWGGDLMEQQGATLVKHYRDLAFMGFTEVVSHLPTILGNFRFCEKDLLAYQPDVMILVDYPGFNLRMAKFAKQNGIRVFYYISPQLWAWHSSRVNDIKKWVDRMFVILPFEQEFYARYNYRVDFQGHPLLDVIHDEMQVPGRKEFLDLSCGIIKKAREFGVAAGGHNGSRGTLNLQMEWAKAGATIILHSSDMFHFADKMQDDINCIRELKGEKTNNLRSTESI